MQRVKERGLPWDASDVVYYVRHDTIVARADHKGLPRVVEQSLLYVAESGADQRAFPHAENKGGGNRGRPHLA